MSSPPFIHIDEFNGADRFVTTKASSTTTIDLRSHEPHQKVMLGDSERGDVQRPCVVFNDDITLEGGVATVSVASTTNGTTVRKSS